MKYHEVSWIDGRKRKSSRNTVQFGFTLMKTTSSPFWDSWDFLRLLNRIRCFNEIWGCICPQRRGLAIDEFTQIWKGWRAGCTTFVDERYLASRMQLTCEPLPQHLCLFFLSGQCSKWDQKWDFQVFVIPFRASQVHTVHLWLCNVVWCLDDAVWNHWTELHNGEPNRRSFSCKLFNQTLILEVCFHSSQSDSVCWKVLLWDPWAKELVLNQSRDRRHHLSESQH